MAQLGESCSRARDRQTKGVRGRINLAGLVTVWSSAYLYNAGCNSRGSASCHWKRRGHADRRTQHLPLAWVVNAKTAADGAMRCWLTVLGQRAA